MAEGEIKVEQESFDCPQTGCTVDVTKKLRIYRDPVTDEIKKREPAAFDCNKKLQCGIGTRSGCRIIYDWSKCAYQWVED